jgi:gliding motility-associated-like protein
VRSPTFITAAAIGATSYQWYAVANGGYSSANGAVGAAKDSLEVKESGHYAACAYMGYENGLQCASDMSLPKQIQLFDVPFTPIIEGKGTACAGDTIILEAISESGDPATIASYAWSKNGNRLDFATTRTCMVTQIEDAKYTVVAISDKGCVSDASAAKDVRIRKPTVSVASDKTETCHGGSITLEAKTNTGVGSTYEWYKNDSLITNIGPICMVSGGVDPQKDQTSYYYLYVTDEQGCKSALPSNTVSVNIYGIPRPLAVKVSDPMCEGGGITLTADPSGEGTYQWFAEKSSVFEPVGIASAAAQYQLKDIRVADAGRYKVEVTNRWGCKAEGTERVVVYALPSSPMLTPGDARHLLCTGDSVVLTAYTLNSNSTYSYDWYFDNGLSRTSISSVDGRIYASMAGVYSVQSVSDHGCTSQATSEVTVEVYRKPAAPFISPDGRVTVCANGAVSITGFAAGATSYQWYTVDTATGRYGAISGAIYSSYEVGFSGRYAVRADIYYNADRTCSALSLPKEVELLPLLSPPVITGEKTAEGGEKTSGCDGDILTLTATIPESTEGASFKWYKKGSVDEDFIELPSSLAAASYTITKVEVAEYQVKAISSKGCYSEASNPKEVTIRRRPTVTIADLTEAERNPCGGTVTLTANPNPNLAGGSYEWYENGAHMENAKTSSLYVVQGSSNPQEGREASCYLYVTDRYGCRSATPSNTVVVNIHALPQTPTVTADPPQGVCHGSNATLTASPAGAGNYRWYKRLSRSLDSLIYVTSDANLRIVGALTADAGLYAVEIVNTYGCKSASKGEVGLNMLELPEVRIIETRACESWTEERTVKFATPAGGTFSGWGCANGKFNPSDVHQGTANIKYTYKAPNGCENSDEKAITIVSLPNTPIVAANGPTEVCEDSVVVTLQANVAEEYAAGYTYRWRRNGAVMPNEAASAYVARKAGAYDVQIWNDSLCWSASASDPVAISVKELPAAPLIAAQNAAFFCPGSATMLLVEKSAPGSFQWYKGDSKGMAELPAEIDSSYSAGEVGQYAVKLFGENECWSPFSNLVTMGEYPLPRQPEVVPSQSTLYVGMNYSLLVKAPQAGETYGWYRNDLATGTSGVSLTIPNLSSNDTGRYTVQAVDEHGCFVWSEAYRLAWAETQLFVPNVFTPNGDGINDYFQIVGLENFVENKLDILNSRGVVIFSQKNYANTWSGAELIGGIYYYTLALKHEDGTSSTMRGFIHVKR